MVLLKEYFWTEVKKDNDIERKNNQAGFFLYKTVEKAKEAFEEFKNEMLSKGYKIEDSGQNWCRLKDNNDYVVFELFIINDFNDGDYIEIC